MPVEKPVKYPELAKRIEQAINRSTAIPNGHGQYANISRKFQRRYGEKVSIEHVRNWVKGYHEPQANRRAHLAEILEVDPQWLFGTSAVPVRPTRAGSETLIGPMLQAGGWKVRYADTTDYDLDAELGGRAYKIECKTSKRLDDGRYVVTMPKNADDVVVLSTMIDPMTATLRLVLVSGAAGSEVMFNESGDATGGEVRIVTSLNQPL